MYVGVLSACGCLSTMYLDLRERQARASGQCPGAGAALLCCERPMGAGNDPLCLWKSRWCSSGLGPLSRSWFFFCFQYWLLLCAQASLALSLLNTEASCHPWLRSALERVKAHQAPQESELPGQFRAEGSTDILKLGFKVRLSPGAG